MKFLTLSILITIYTPLLCYATEAPKIVLLEDCDPNQCTYIRNVLSETAEWAETTHHLNEEYRFSELALMFLALSDNALVRYSYIHFKHVALVIKASGAIRQVNSLEPNTIHISCEGMKRHLPLTVDAYWSDDGNVLRIGPDFFPGGSAEDIRTGKPLEPVKALDADVSRYKEALAKAPTDEPFVNFPFPTSSIIKLFELFQAIPLLMGRYTLHRVTPTPATPRGLVNFHTIYAQAYSILMFLARADPKRFEVGGHRHGIGAFGLPKSGLELGPVPLEQLHSPSSPSSESPSPHSSPARLPSPPNTPHSSSSESELEPDDEGPWVKLHRDRTRYPGVKGDRMVNRVKMAIKKAKKKKSLKNSPMPKSAEPSPPAPLKLPVPRGAVEQLHSPSSPSSKLPSPHSSPSRSPSPPNTPHSSSSRSPSPPNTPHSSSSGPSPHHRRQMQKSGL